ncbi:NADP-binding protein [Dacryopinax primogenitus]|uniref:NADP-binding protein n=1 Tax=Dacryopinax primogenitus (strain DJM 731) TaxID=1858805 RepID=M5FYG8_DACPD|nr:NADP-binding protein [Dacryopinax primogenitus]EJU03091.1 NADP-binding protein [Dacryopinax primogenitus]
MSKVVVLTGGNKGIGKAVAMLLLKTTKQPLTLYLTARQPGLGAAAIDDINSSGLPSTSGSHLVFHQLDITDQSSVDTLAADLKASHGQIDVLINNAGIATKGSRFDSEVVKQTLDCNYFGTQRICDALIPLIKPEGGRLVCVSSSAGLLSSLPSASLRPQFSDSHLTHQQLDQLMNKFAADVVSGTYRHEGWPQNSYAVSKVGMTALTKICAREHPGMVINACCPGYVKTDMAPNGFLTPEGGSFTPTLLAIGDIGNTSGLFWKNCYSVTW